MELNNYGLDEVRRQAQWLFTKCAILYRKVPNVFDSPGTHIDDCCFYHIWFALALQFLERRVSDDDAYNGRRGEPARGQAVNVLP